MAYRPLADEIRPKNLDEVVGQRHILGQDGLLRRIIESGEIPNLIFYGPPARERPRWPTSSPSGPTAPPPAQRYHRLHQRHQGHHRRHRHPAGPGGCCSTWTRSSISIKKAAVPAGVYGEWEDHPHRLHHGKPVFYVFGAVLSRSTVFEFKQITAEDALPRRGPGWTSWRSGWAGAWFWRGGAGAYRLRLRRGHPQGYERPGAAGLRRPAGEWGAAHHPGGRPDGGPEVRHAL